MDNERVKTWFENLEQPEEGVLFERALNKTERLSSKSRGMQPIPIALCALSLGLLAFAGSHLRNSGGHPALPPGDPGLAGSHLALVPRHLAQNQPPPASPPTTTQPLGTRAFSSQPPSRWVPGEGVSTKRRAVIDLRPYIFPLRPEERGRQPERDESEERALQGRGPNLGQHQDDLAFINARPEEALSAPTPDIPREKESEFIVVPVPQVASSGNAGVALNAYESERQIVDMRLQKRVALGEKGISFADLCAKLTQETGVTFTAGRSVADDKITVFCGARTLRDLMRQVNRIFGYVWERNGTDPDFRYRLVQPISGQVAEEEKRNKEKVSSMVQFLSLSRLDDGNKEAVLRGEFNVVLADAQDMSGTEKLSRDLSVSFLLDDSKPGVVLDKNYLKTMGLKAFEVVATDFSWSAISAFSDYSNFPDPENAKNNEALKEIAFFPQKVSISPEPTLKDEKLCTTGDVLEAIHKATKQDVMGDYFTRFMPQSDVTLKEKTLFDALNTLGDRTKLRWDWEKAKTEGESDWLQFRTSGYYLAREREVPSRLLERWQESSRRQMGKLSALDLGEIARLSDAQLDSQSMATGAVKQYGLTEWPLVQNATLRPHWHAFGVLSRGRQTDALSERGLLFRQLPLDPQQELASLIATAGRGANPGATLSFDDFPSALLQVRYPAPPGEPIFRYRRVGQPGTFWRWEIGQAGSSVTKEE